MFIVFNLAQLSAICISFIVLGFLLAYLLKSLTLKILFIVLTICKNSIFPFKNKSTNTSFAAFIIIGVESPNLKHLLSSLIETSISKDKPIIVLNKNSEKIGVITQSDLLKAVVEGNEGE